MSWAWRQAGHTAEGPSAPSRVHGTRRWWIDVAMGGVVARVELPRLVVVRVDGVDLACLDELWSAAHLGVPAAALVFDFVGEDGSHLATEEGSLVGGRELSTGYVAVATRDLVWQPTPPRPPSWSVKRVARVTASPAPRESLAR